MMTTPPAGIVVQVDVRIRENLAVRLVLRLRKFL
jgi:hypothetical protein